MSQEKEIDFLLDGMDYEPTIVAGFTQTELFISAGVGAAIAIPLAMISLLMLGISPILGIPIGFVLTLVIMVLVSKWLKFKKRNGRDSESVYAELEVKLMKKHGIKIGSYDHIFEKSCWDTERSSELKRIYQKEEEDDE
ncbi:DUF3487 family protein [Motilimonas eburnea]|uniref:DUF3487 family protein n=1 Tax=Motilimonas eburnea TaxID=1737488 RepID=UPI001E53CC09|nr:TIGR03750 family conjugal transfer protein [Motilimonas eburnea]